MCYDGHYRYSFAHEHFHNPFHQCWKDIPFHRCWEIILFDDTFLLRHINSHCHFHYHFHCHYGLFLSGSFFYTFFYYIDIISIHQCYWISDWFLDLLAFTFCFVFYFPKIIRQFVGIHFVLFPLQCYTFGLWRELIFSNINIFYKSKKLE